MQLSVGDVVHLLGLVEQGSREGGSVHVFGGAGWWLVEYRIGIDRVTAEAVSLTHAIEDVKRKAALD